MGVAGTEVDTGIAAEVTEPSRRASWSALVRVTSGLPEVAKSSDRLVTLCVSQPQTGDCPQPLHCCRLSRRRDGRERCEAERPADWEQFVEGSAISHGPASRYSRTMKSSRKPLAPDLTVFQTVNRRFEPLAPSAIDH